MDFQHSSSEINGERDPKHDIIEEEVDLYMASFKIDANEKHDFYYEKKKRADECQEEHQRMKRKSNDAENILQIKHKSQFFQQLIKTDVSSTRRLTQPAYVFEKFPHLPQELQIIIWRMAAEDKNTDRYSFVNYGNQDDIHRPFHRGVSSAIATKNINYEPVEPGNKPSGNIYIPAVLHACRLARDVAETVYTCLPIDYGETTTYEALSRQAYFDLVNDEFLLPWKMVLPRLRWIEHRIIVDLLIKHHATKGQWESLPATLRKHVESLLKIRNLQMDLRTFYNVPPHIWAEFSMLECLTILISPTNSIGDVSVQDRTFKPKPGTKFGKRADWIWGYCYKLLNSVKKDFPNWRHPKIKVLLIDDPECEETYEEANPEEYDQVHPSPPPGDKLHIPFPGWLDHYQTFIYPTRNNNVYLPEKSELDEGDDFEWYRMQRLPKFSLEVTKKDLQFGQQWPFDEYNY
ncbi:021e3107-2f35-4da0-93e2-dfa1b3f25276 [Sclerotinia trifoliorum]|uniref:021e3107-2f35-4da0-93e2-dfa1b3f25276 n=1 Tax=Sclerotinia trifoliorum TaxID=28548 RepID=A0A8H2ZQ13_9HELO|nr:021e3107-2f35-4da0-93e2-dfa1b3f25276 [Sclerotinia trifoliorum]